ncbi:MAG: hypothetical protein K8S98_13710 [Planctomycetes bacterium]|nr:hypothetical protein [Planctomycetota bacterium]
MSLVLPFGAHGALLALAVATTTLPARQESTTPTPIQAPVPKAPAIPPEELRARLATRFEGALADSNNGQDFAQTQGYMKLLSAVTQFTPQDATLRATRHLDWHAAMAAPDEWRGEWVTYRGQLAALAAEKLVSPVDGRENVWRATVVNDTEGIKDPPEGGVFIDLLDKPEGSFDPRRDVVDVVGVFYRTVAYENFQGRPRNAVYLIGRVLKPIDKAVATSTQVPWWGFLMIGGALMIGGLHLFNILRGRPKRQRAEELGSTDFRKMFDARTKGQTPKPRTGTSHGSPPGSAP